MRSLRFISFLSMLIVVALLLAAPTFAQDISTPEPTFAPTRVVTDAAPVVDPVPTGDDITPVDLHDTADALIATFIANMWAAIQGAGLAPLVVIIVGVIKYVPFVKKLIAEGRFSVNLLVFVVALLVFLIAGTANWFGFTEQFQGAAAWLVEGLPRTIQFLGLIFGAPWLHEIAYSFNVPVLGKKVTPPLDAILVSPSVTDSSGGAAFPASAAVRGDYVTRDELRELVSKIDQLHQALNRG